MLHVNKMFASRCCQIPVTAFVSGLSKTNSKPIQICQKFQIQMYATRSGIGRKAARTKTIKEIAMAPAGESAFGIGRGVLAGASVVGLGALCYYGLGMSSEVGARERSVLWSPEVRQRVRATYMYLGGSIVITAASAVAVSRNPRLMSMMMKNSWVAIGATFAAMIGAMTVCRSIPYKPGFGAKQLAWMAYGGVMGAVLAPITLLGGPLLVRAAWYTAGVVGGLSCIAVCAPSEKFLTMGGPLAIGLGVVFVSSIGSMFLAPTSALGAGLYSVSIYGGLVLFSMFLLYDTQKVIKKAETHPPYAAVPYDPINSCLGIYLDTVNIFIRIATILAGGGGRRK